MLYFVLLLERINHFTDGFIQIVVMSLLNSTILFVNFSITFINYLLRMKNTTIVTKYKWHLPMVLLRALVWGMSSRDGVGARRRGVINVTQTHPFHCWARATYIITAAVLPAFVLTVLVASGARMVLETSKNDRWMGLFFQKVLGCVCFRSLDHLGCTHGGPAKVLQ